MKKPFPRQGGKSRNIRFLAAGGRALPELYSRGNGRMIMEENNMEIWRMLGQRMCVGFEGTEITRALRDLVRKYQVGNVILFRENLTSAEQARRLCGEITELIRGETGRPPFFFIDQEGGMVTRLPGDMVNVSGAMALAATGDPGAARQAARLTAGELLRAGITFNLAPVLDVNSNGANPVIGVRSYGDRPEVVETYALEAVLGYQEAGVLCAGKHFPGHGDTHLDSHLALPTVRKSRRELEEGELRPFRAAVRAGIPAIMTSHILFPALEPEALPATMSRRILTGLLRKEMGFSGLILSDGMEMGAIREVYGTPEGCIRAAQAGVDIVFVCHDPVLMEAGMLALRQAYDAGEIDPEENRVAVERILSYKTRMEKTLRELDPALSSPEALALRRTENAELMERTLTRVPPKQGLLPSLGGRPLVVGPLAYRSTIASTAPDTALSFPDWFAGRLGGVGEAVPVRPENDDIDRCLAALESATGLLVGTYNGHLNREQLELANRLADRAAQLGLPAVAVALRNPYDLKDIRETAVRLAAYEYSENSFAALLPVLRGEKIPQGTLPVEL